MPQTFEIPLDIPDVTIESVQTTPAGHIEITVKRTVEGTPCHRCGQVTTQGYGEDREISLRHLPILGRQTVIRLRPRRYHCPSCSGKPTTTQRLSWYTPQRYPENRFRAAHRLFLVNIGLQVCDGLLTYYGLSLGFQEGNPLIQVTIDYWGPGWGIAIWKAEACGMFVLLRGLARYPAAVVALAGPLAAISSSRCCHGWGCCSPTFLFDSGVLNRSPVPAGRNDDERL